MYVVTTPELIQAIQKQPKNLAFAPIEAMVAIKLCGSSTEAKKLVMTNVNGDEGDWGLLHDTYSMIYATLKPGPELDAMNRAMIQNLAKALDDLRPPDGKRAQIKLAKWVCGCITAATTNSAYGPRNPFKSEDVVNGFW